MSGFFGILRFDDKPVEESFLEAIADKMSFRGPDGRSIWKQNNLAGCFTLMRTGPAPQASQQPVNWRNLWLWGDLRLDGRNDLFRQLAIDPAESPTITSEELLLRAWSKWGAASLERIIGDFSFALWDAQKESLWCARDFIGPRPFYYARAGDIFCFSNTMDVLRSVPEVSGEFDNVFLGDFLMEGWNTELNRTVYRDIRRVPPGRLLKFSKHGLEENRFRKIPIEDPLHLKRAHDYPEAYRELLNLAVEDRLLNDASSLYLSGGLDSSTVCAVAAQSAESRSAKANLKAFTISWEAFFADPEPPVAKITAQYIGLAQEILREQVLSPFEAVSNPSERIPEPGHETFFAREHRQASRIAAHSHVVLSGDGGDDVLTGQGWPYLVHLLRRRAWNQIVREYGGFFWSHKRFPPLRGGFRTRFRQLLRWDNPLADYPDWLNPEFAHRQNLRQRWLDLRNRPVCHEHPFHPEAYNALHDGYWGEILEGEDAGWNCVPLETRAPLLDLRILTFLLRLPPVPWCVDKELGRKAMKNALPNAVLERPKAPLLRDPLEVCQEQGEWISRLPKEPPEALKEFVNWPRLWETFSCSKGSLTWRILRPVCLLYWLKAVENS